MPDTAENLPKGVVAIFTDEHGRSIAQVSDFNTSGYGGYSLKEAQKFRCKQQISMAVLKAYSSEMLWRGVDQHYAKEIVNNLVAHHGCHVHYAYIGHEESEDA